MCAFVVIAQIQQNPNYRLLDRSHFSPKVDLGVLSKYINYHD
jgi:hypothetical protein